MQTEPENIRPDLERLHNEDVELTRSLVKNAIRDAIEAWVPADAVKDAIILELIDFVGRYETSEKTADRLDALAALLRGSDAIRQ